MREGGGRKKVAIKYSFQVGKFITPPPGRKGLKGLYTGRRK